MFEAKITCDGGSCSNEKVLDSNHPSDTEIEIECIGERQGGWLIDHENENHYCPKCAFQAAQELDLEYASS